MHRRERTAIPPSRKNARLFSMRSSLPKIMQSMCQVHRRFWPNFRGPVSSKCPSTWPHAFGVSDGDSLEIEFTGKSDLKRRLFGDVARTYSNIDRAFQHAHLGSRAL